MIEWLTVQVDTLDVVVIFFVLVATVYFFFLNRSDKSASLYAPQIVAITPSTTRSESRNASFITRMQTEGRQVSTILLLSLI